MSYEIKLGRYYSRFSTKTQYKDYKKLIFRAGDALQSAEMNELQDQAHYELTTLANRFVANGEMLKGGEVLITRTDETQVNNESVYNFNFKCGAGTAYVSTYFVNIPETTLHINAVSQPLAAGTLGIQLTYIVVTDSEDTSLRDPAIETRNYQQPGAARLKVVGQWLLQSDFVENGSNEFIPLYSIEKGEITSVIGAQKWDDSFIDIAAKYDRNANGNYVVEGYEASFLEKVDDSNTGPYIIDIADGSANVYGYNFEHSISQNLEIKPLTDFERKNTEPFNFIGDGAYEPRHTPLKKIYRVSGFVRVSETSPQDSERVNHTHGNFAGATDEIGIPAIQPVSKLFRVYDDINNKDNANGDYVQDFDYKQNGDYIEWQAVGSAGWDTEKAPAGRTTTIEPNTGAAYKIEFNYGKTILQDELVNLSGNVTGNITADFHKVYLGGFDNNTQVSVDYEFILKRSDAVYINAEGDLGSITGVPDEDEPRTPQIDNKGNILQLASVELGGDFDPIVRQDNQRVFKMADIQLILDSVKENEYNIARLALNTNLSENQPGVSFKNTFLDDFDDDENRDTGYANQTALTVGGNLILETKFDEAVVDGASPSQLQYTIPTGSPDKYAIEIPSIAQGVILNQPYYTKARKINAYLFKAAPEVKLEVTPRIYRWVSRNNYRRYVASLRGSTAFANSWTTRFRVFGTHRWHSLIRTTNRTTSVSRQILGSSTRTSNSVSTSRTPEIIPRIRLRLTVPDGSFNNDELVNLYFADKKINSNGASTIGSGLQANPTGGLNQTFIIPSRQFSGMKEIRVDGADSGASGKTFFQAQPLIRNIQTTVTQWWRWVVRRQSTRWFEADPVAQSFVLNESASIDSISVYFDVLPTTDTSLVITETTAGFPDKTKALTSVTLTPDQLRLAGNTNNATKFTFDSKPVLTKGTEYAFIVICSDAIGAVRCATLGERDKSGSGKWLTSQAYSVGAMFTSSNNSAWSVIQEDDIQFKINKCDFNYAGSLDGNTVYGLSVVEASPAGGFDVSGVTDVMLLSNAKIEENTSVEYRITLLDRTVNNVFKVNSYSQIPLTTAYTGKIKVEAILKTVGNKLFTPKLDPSIQLCAGKTVREGKYISKTFDWNEDSNIIDVYLDMYKPSGSDVSIFYQDKDYGPDIETGWIKLPMVENAREIGFGWAEQHFRFDVSTLSSAEKRPKNIDDIFSGKTRVKIVLTATNDINRPVVSNLRTTLQKI